MSRAQKPSAAIAPPPCQLRGRTGITRGSQGRVVEPDRGSGLPGAAGPSGETQNPECVALTVCVTDSQTTPDRGEAGRLDRRIAEVLRIEIW
ncbi:hypothetical protein NDU88_007142 [Pleurodeles waltl]|uniref:Uncharacterized protein n=1 Tax=Pleurodeles waltl TaxID=8319 RepID=A0AAV7RSA7_PLEWA|nr:hypothetical protein NDU88_007142 [Pleurodeles waltl]